MYRELFEIKEQIASSSLLAMTAVNVGEKGFAENAFHK